ncbi:hypothetical protein [Mesorhizobium sp. WSM2239]|uniref:Uncharacterized protein n=2 Tax=unclassified Mesorhizobium TaxID=325217 RepID=A0AAU8DJE8_9HYPH
MGFAGTILANGCVAHLQREQVFVSGLGMSLRRHVVAASCFLTHLPRLNHDEGTKGSMALTWILAIVILVLAIAALVKFLTN